jgi:hypothetical protein
MLGVLSPFADRFLAPHWWLRANERLSRVFKSLARLAGLHSLTIQPWPC